MNSKQSYVVVSVAYLPKVCIHIYYHDVIVIFKNLNIKYLMHKTEGVVKCPIVYLRNIKILSLVMEDIAIKQHQTFIWIKCE